MLISLILRKSFTVLHRFQRGQEGVGPEDRLRGPNP